MNGESRNDVALYDFHRAGDLPREVGDYLTRWHESFCTTLPDRWSDLIAFEMSWNVRSIRLARASAALAELPETAVGFRIRADAEDQAALVVWPRQLALLLVVGMLGDKGAELPEDRPLTSLEESLAETALDAMLGALNESQPTLAPASFRFVHRVAKPHQTRLFAGSGNVGVVDFEITGPFGRQDARWLVSEKALDRIGEAVEAQQVADVGSKEQLEQTVREIPIEVTVHLGSVRLHVSELAQLQPGDVLVLDQRISDPLEANVDGKTKYYGWPGRVGPRQAFQIESE